MVIAHGPALGGPAGPVTSGNQVVVSSRSTDERGFPEGGEKVDRPSHQTASLPAALIANPPVLTANGSNLLSKQSRAETDEPGIIGLSMGDDVSAITQFLRESCCINGPILETRSQLVDSHTEFINSVAKVFCFPLLILSLLLMSLILVFLSCSCSI